jgi:hypothetical protein
MAAAERAVLTSMPASDFLAFHAAGLAVNRLVFQGLPGSNPDGRLSAGVPRRNVDYSQYRTAPDCRAC